MLEFLADLAFLGSKLIIKIKKWPSFYVKWYPGVDQGEVLFCQIFDKSLTKVNIDI